MTSSHGRRIQGRRALAMMAWVSLVIIAGLLWYGQEEGVIRIQAWEPAALLLSAYSAFLAIFGWLLFAPERKSAEESPALFFSGMLTLIPPCFIAYHLMPPSSPLRGWLTLGVFVFGLFAILSPLPDEVFAVPRDRRSYLRPLTDCYLSVLDVEEPQLDLQNLVPRARYTLTRPDAKSPPDIRSGDSHDPWTDPFYGTGRTMSEVGSALRPTYSEGRSRDSHVRSDSAPLREPVSQESSREASSRDAASRDSASRVRTQEEYRDRSLSQTRETQRAPGLGYPASPISPLHAPPMRPAIPSDPTIQTTSGLSRPPMTARSAFAPRESRAPNYQPQTTTQVTGAPRTIDPLTTSVSSTASRRPLTEPGGRTAPPVEFQTHPASWPITSSLPPVPAYMAPTSLPGSISKQIPSVSQRAFSESNRATSSHVAPVVRSAFLPPVPLAVPQELLSRPAPPVLDSSLGLGLIAPATPLASSDTYDDMLESAVSEVRSITDLDPQVTSPTVGTSPLNDVKMERLMDEQGGEMIDGTIRVFFEIGQKRAHLHVPFSPPLAGLPEVECEAVSDDSVRCKVAVRQPYGIRIEARRSDASRPLNTEIGFAAVYTPSTRRG